MLKQTLIAASLLCVVPAMAQTDPAAPPEAKIRNMSEYIEAVIDPGTGVYIQGYTGQWYYARVRNCARLNRNARLRFEPSPGGDFDQHSMIRADGWRCFVESVVEVEGLPSRLS